MTIIITIIVIIHMCMIFVLRDFGWHLPYGHIRLLKAAGLGGSDTPAVKKTARHSSLSELDLVPGGSSWRILVLFWQVCVLWLVQTESLWKNSQNHLFKIQKPTKKQRYFNHCVLVLIPSSPLKTSVPWILTSMRQRSANTWCLDWKCKAEQVLVGE